MSEHETQLQEARYLSALLFSVSERSMSDFAEAVGAVGLSVPLARALLHLGSGTPMRDLAVHLTCDPSYVTALADQLEERGLVVRVAGSDRRVKLLELTDEGRALRASLGDAIAQGATIIKQLDEAARHQLSQLLERVLNGQPLDRTDQNRPRVGDSTPNTGP